MLSRILEDFATSVWVERVGWTLLHSLWQIFLIVSAYYLLSFQLRKNSAFSRYITGCTALVAILVAPLATFCLLPDQQVAVARVVDQESDDVSPQPLNDISISPNTVELNTVEPRFAESGAFGPEVSLSSAYVAPTAEPVEVPAEIEKIAAAMRPWLPLITVLWLVGVVLLSMRPVMGCFYVRRLKRFGLSAVPDSVLEACDELMRKMKIQHAVQVFQSSLVHSPVVVGYLRPMILLPASAITGLTARELELILAHELAHIRKHDYLVNLVQTVIEALLFYHPGMWWMSAQVRRERENCCDDVAVAIGSDRATYIRALTLLEQQRVASPALAATGGALLSRVRRLVGGPGSEFVYRKSSLWLTALVMFGIAVTTIGFAGTTSDQPDEAKDTLEIVEHDDGKAEAALSFDKLVGQKVAQVVRKAKLPFVDETQIKKTEADFTSFMNNDVPYGTWRVGSSIPKNRRQAILAAIENHGAKHLKISQFPQTNLRSINLAYLGMPDQLLTLKWKLHRAIVNARKLDKEKQAKLESQRSWMKQYVQSLPANKFFTHERALFALEERFADPLACTLGYPMTDEQFEAFRQGLQKSAPQRELNYVVSYIVQQSLNAQYRDFTDFETPFKDRVVSYGAGRVVHLGFEQNRLFESSLRSISDVENSGTVVDATTGFLITAPKEYREGNELQSWLGEKGKGDFGFDDANGGGLFAVRGAKLARLDVKTWHEADAIGNKDLRALLNKASAGSVVQLKKHYQDYQQDNGAPYCYAGVLTKEGRLAVVAVEDFSGRSRIAVRTRVRAAVPAMKNVTRSGENGFPGHRIEGGTVKEEGGSDGNWGEGTEGVQLKIHSLDVQFVKGQWKVKCKTDIRSSEERVLPPHGAPIGEYVIEWDGKGYRPVWSISGSSLAPLRAFNRNSMHTEIEAHGWVDEETGKPLLLSAGTHTLRIALPIVDSPEGAENQQSQKRAVSNKIDVTVPANQPDAVTWGSEKDGLLLGIDLADVQAMRNWQPGLKLYNEARGIGITQTSELPEIWVEVPPGSKSYEVRKDVRVTNATLDTTIYERPDLNQFWVQRDQVGSSFRTFFGPFNGDPFQVLGIQVNHAKNRIVGEWVGGGAIMPVFHTFSANRNYEKRIGERTADPERGAWQLEDNLLTRQFDGQEDSTQPIEWIDQNAFRIELPNDKSAVYRRVDAKTGNVILPEVSEGKKPITAAKNFADELLLIISKERGGQISPGGIGYSLDHEFLTIDQLQQSLKEKLEAHPTRELLVRADPEVPYQMVVVALQLAKAAGVKNVRIASQVIDVQNYKDGGTTAFILHRPDQKPIRVCFDYRDRLPVEGSSWKIAGNLTLGRMFSGADYPAKPNAQLVGIGSEEEKRLLSGLNEWLDQQLSKELQTRMLSEARSAESLKRLAATMGKTVDELRELSSLLRKTRQYELVFVQSNGVYVTLQRQAEPQANPSRIPQFLISVVNRGEIEKLTLGRTDQAFELEVDGKWYRQVRFEYKSSPLPPGRIYESFPLTLDQRWLHDGTPLELSPGRHTIRVRCSVHPFGSDKAASLATSQPMTMIVGTDKVEKEAKPDPEKSKQGQTDQ